MHQARLNRDLTAAAAVFVLLLAAMTSGAVQAANAEKYSAGLSAKLKSAPPGEKIQVIVVLDNATDAGKTLKAGTIKKRYSIINAASAELTEEEVDELGKQQGIMKIYLDRVSQIPPTDLLDTDNTAKAGLMSVNMDTIGATYVQNNLNHTGRNVTIAIVDTGIDYTHPDLGGCLGAGCKVKGGYNYVNDSSDPMDYNGHGTHCAGIAAANGGMKGVAPDADLLALKVCDDSGCTDSNTIAGIDWAVRHGANVISLSLGSSIQPSDGYGPVEMACDAAAQRGIVVVAAAGNEGPGSETIADVASAKEAIGVGSDDDMGTADARDDRVSDFSCNGPAAFGRLKPDLIAPGENIRSTCMGGGYCYKRGTSMATPHVAGAAALLIEHNRSLSPGQIKSLLMHSAQNISGNVFAMGAGLINVTRAIRSETTASVNGKSSWEETIIPGMSTTAALRIKNERASEQDYVLSLADPADSERDHSINAGLFSYPPSLSLGPGEEKSVIVNVSTQDTAPGTYGGALMLRSPDETIRIPIALTIPLSGSGTINGSVDDYCSANSPQDCGDTPENLNSAWGDWRFYKIVDGHNTQLERKRQRPRPLPFRAQRRTNDRFRE